MTSSLSGVIDCRRRIARAIVHPRALLYLSFLETKSSLDDTSPSLDSLEGLVSRLSSIAVALSTPDFEASSLFDELPALISCLDLFFRLLRAPSSLPGAVHSRRVALCRSLSSTCGQCSPSSTSAGLDSLPHSLSACIVTSLARLVSSLRMAPTLDIDAPFGQPSLLSWRCLHSLSRFQHDSTGVRFGFVVESLVVKEGVAFLRTIDLGEIIGLTLTASDRIVDVLATLSYLIESPSARSSRFFARYETFDSSAYSITPSASKDYEFVFWALVDLFRAILVALPRSSTTRLPLSSLSCSSPSLIWAALRLLGSLAQESREISLYLLGKKRFKKRTRVFDDGNEDDFTSVTSEPQFLKSLLDFAQAPSSLLSRHHRSHHGYSFSFSVQKNGGVTRKVRLASLRCLGFIMKFVPSLRLTFPITRLASRLLRIVMFKECRRDALRCLHRLASNDVLFAEALWSGHVRHSFFHLILSAVSSSSDGMRSHAIGSQDEKWSSKEDLGIVFQLLAVMFRDDFTNLTSRLAWMKEIEDGIIGYIANLFSDPEPSLLKMRVMEFLVQYTKLNVRIRRLVFLRIIDVGDANLDEEEEEGEGEVVLGLILKSFRRGLESDLLESGLGSEECRIRLEFQALSAKVLSHLCIDVPNAKRLVLSHFFHSILHCVEGADVSSNSDEDSPHYRLRLRSLCFWILKNLAFSAPEDVRRALIHEYSFFVRVALNSNEFGHSALTILRNLGFASWSEVQVLFRMSYPALIRIVQNQSDAFSSASVIQAIFLASQAFVWKNQRPLVVSSEEIVVGEAQRIAKKRRSHETRFEADRTALLHSVFDRLLTRNEGDPDCSALVWCVLCAWNANRDATRDLLEERPDVLEATAKLCNHLAFDADIKKKAREMTRLLS